MNFIWFCMIVTFTHISFYQTTTHRKHVKRTKKYNDFRKDLISHLPQSKLLDIILNRAVSEIIDSMKKPGSISDTGKRKQIAINQKEQVIDYESLSDQFKNNLRSIKLKNGDLVMDPFAGQDDPYKNTDRSDPNMSADRKDRLSDLVDSVQNDGWKDIPTENHKQHNHNSNHEIDTEIDNHVSDSHKTHKGGINYENHRSRSHQTNETDKNTIENNEISESDKHTNNDADYDNDSSSNHNGSDRESDNNAQEENQDNTNKNKVSKQSKHVIAKFRQADSEEEFRDTENESIDSIYHTKRKESKVDEASNRDKVSEILPIKNGNIVLLKDSSDYKELKLDVPNIHFDAKLNSSYQRDKIVANLKRVVGVLYQLKFPRHFHNNETYETKHTALEVGDKRDSEEKITKKAESSAREDLTNRINEKQSASFSDAMFPDHGSYVVEHGGNIFRIEKIPVVHPIMETHNIIKDQSTSQEKENNGYLINSLDGHEDPQPGMVQETPTLDKPIESPAVITQHEHIKDLDVHHKHEVKDAYVIKHGGQVYKVLQSDEHNVKVNNIKEPVKSLTGIETEPLQNNEHSEESEPNNKIQTDASSEHSLKMADTTARIGQPSNENADNTYEIKHNNKIFRITEITQKPPLVRTEDPATRGFDDSPPGGYTEPARQYNKTLGTDYKGAQLYTKYGDINTNNHNISTTAENDISESDSSNADIVDTTDDVVSPNSDTILAVIDNEDKPKFIHNTTKNYLDDNTITQQQPVLSFANIKGTDDNDDDYVTYVFKTKNATFANNYPESINNTLNEDVVP